MHLTARSLFHRAVATAGIASAAGLAAVPSGGGEERREPIEAAIPEALTAAEARGRARLLQETYEATLHVIHRRYFDRDEKDVIPARALEDVFRTADKGTGRMTRWIAVNTPPMNVDHAPREGFETRAAEALADGAEEFESVEGGVYRRAGAVTLFASCLRCHESGLTKQISKERVAALVVAMPVRAD